MRLGGGIIKATMNKRGFKHRRSEDQFSIKGEYARNLQFVYSREYQTRAGLVVDLVYFAADISNEKLVIGLYRENPTIDDGIYENGSRSISLKNYDAETIAMEVDKLIPTVPGLLK